jgi:hypothetical protein
LVNLILGELQHYHGLSVVEFAKGDPIAVLLVKVQSGFQGTEIRFERLKKLAELMLSPALWFDEVNRGTQHEGFDYVSSVLTDAMNHYSQHGLGYPKVRSRILHHYMRNSGERFVRLADMDGIAMTLTSTLECLLQAMLGDDGKIPELGVRLIHPNACAVMQTRMSALYA